MKQQQEQQTAANDKTQLKLPAPSVIPSSSANGQMPATKSGTYSFFPNGLAPSITPNGSSMSALLDPPTSPLLYHSQLETLAYSVKAWSSFSAQYHPQNIMLNKPTDQASRWSSGSNNQMQFLTLQLDKPSIVHTITFGKYHKVHVCNLKEFKVYGGMELDNMTELLHSGLRNDSEPETFPLKFKTNDVVFPCNFIKIVPLMAWGANFNFSIWFVELRGIADPALVNYARQEYVSYREKEAIRLCLKHFRQRNMIDSFNALQIGSKLQLEHPMLTRLHQLLVTDGKFEEAEKLVTMAGHEHCFDDYISNACYRAAWKRINATDANGESPSMRGGHQMCIDSETGIIYLFGGWDGSKDLSDFWSYDIAADRWTVISPDTRRQGGPGPRSCHKICFEPVNKQIYIFGRYIDPQSRPGTACESDFYRYDTIFNRWHKISDNVATENGPELIYDHQMIIDAEQQLMFLFGGRIIGPTPPAPENSYSGLYVYDLRKNLWRLLRSDLPQTDGSITLRSRIGHSMLLNTKTRQLYIFAGQRHKDYLSDFYIYDIKNDSIIEMNRDSSKNGGPDAGFTQRATIDCELEEFYVFSGLMREKNSTTDTVKNTFWVYSIKKDKWMRVYQNENMSEEYWKGMGALEPCPRFAHQLVYDTKNKLQYLFGGNPGDSSNTSLRLDDFWSLRLVKPTVQQISRKCMFLIRKQQFREMCNGNDSMRALRYLQVDLASTVDHQDEQESLAFRNLTGSLFEKPNGSPNVFKDRSELYESLLEFFPDFMKQPKRNLVDLIL